MSEPPLACGRCRPAASTGSRIPGSVHWRVTLFYNHWHIYHSYYVRACGNDEGPLWQRLLKIVLSCVIDLSGDDASEWEALFENLLFRGNQLNTICVFLCSCTAAQCRLCHSWGPAGHEPWAIDGISLCLYYTMPMLCLWASPLHKLEPKTQLYW